MTIEYSTMSQRILCAWKQAWYHGVVCMKIHLFSCRPSLEHLVFPFTIYVHGFIPRHRFKNIIHFFVFLCILYCLWYCTYVNKCSRANILKYWTTIRTFLAWKVIMKCVTNIWNSKNPFNCIQYFLCAVWWAKRPIY